MNQALMQKSGKPNQAFEHSPDSNAYFGSEKPGESRSKFIKMVATNESEDKALK